jgi:lipopolysaccharide transport system permease protein
MIEAGSSSSDYLSQVWQYRELCFFLFYRDFVVRYKQTFFGIAWALFRPLITMVVLTVVFSKVAGLSAPGKLPYAVLVYSALLPWQLFSAQLQSCSSSLISNAPMVSKVYFPKLILPLCKVIIGLVDFSVSLIPMVLFMIYYKISLSFSIFLLPVIMFAVSLLVVGLGSFFAAINVKYRDLRFIIPFFVQIGLYVSPVGYSTSLVPARYHMFYCLNPMVAWIEGTRYALGGSSGVLAPECYLVSSIVTLVLFVGGIGYFRRKEDYFADLV